MAEPPRYVPRFAAEPPQEELPYGRWAEQLSREFLAAAAELDGVDELGELGELTWYPDRSWYGFTYSPASCRTEHGFEVFGYVRYRPAREEGEASDFTAQADFTDEVAERYPDWQLDLCEEVVGSWRGVGGRPAAMTLVWGRPLIAGGDFAAGELGGIAVDACPLLGERFTLLAPDAFGGDQLEVLLCDGKGRELARESLYEEGEEEGGGGA